VVGRDRRLRAADQGGTPVIMPGLRRHVQSHIVEERKAVEEQVIVRVSFAALPPVCPSDPAQPERRRLATHR